ncbi:hypothetical protein ATKI12_8776 [Kitasatospora sp. Ki12]
MTTAADRPGPPPLVPPRPDAAVGYVCAVPDIVSAGLFAAWCERRAAGEGWALTEVITDTDELQSLTERPGWRRVTELVAAGTIGAVITVNRSMVAPAAQGWARVSDRLAGHGVALVTTGSTARAREAQDGSR